MAIASGIGCDGYTTVAGIEVLVMVVNNDNCAIK